MITILFHLKRRKNSKGEQPIYLRLTVNGVRKEKSLNRSISSYKWDKNKQHGKGRSEEIQSLNVFISSVKSRLYQKHQEMLNNEEPISAETLMNRYLGKEEKSKTLLEIINNENIKKSKLISTGGFKKYQSFLKNLKEFLKFQYNVSDIDIKQIDYKFITDFDFYLRIDKNPSANVTVKGISNNVAVRYIKILKMYYTIAFNNGWVKSTPFANYKSSLDQIERVKLTKNELSSIDDKSISNFRLNRVRDVFLFACYTGLSFVDLESLNNNHIVIGMDGKKWIKLNRAKTGNLSSIPLLPKAEEIIKKYKSDPECIHRGILLPIVSNQRYNAYLKEIADLCGITKNLTSHVARHTFATTITAEKGVSTEVVSKMLGHTQLKTTQIYLKITDTRIAKDMKVLFDEEKEDNESKEAI